MSDLLIFLASLAITIIGAEWFLKSSISLARILRLPEMVVGATLVSLATTMPENLVSVFAALGRHNSLALGNIVGSGLVNLGLIFGLTLLFERNKEETHGGRGRRRSLILLLLITLIYLWLILFGGISFLGGLILMAGGLCYLIYTLGYALKESGEKVEVVEEKLEAHPGLLFKFLISSLILVVGARFLVESGVNLAKTFALPEIIIGITLVAIGTSLPELVTALVALTTRHERITLGNLTGATVLTLTLALGLAAILGEVTISQQILFSDFLILFVFSFLVFLTSWRLAFFAKISTRIIGLILVAGYLGYLFFLF